MLQRQVDEYENEIRALKEFKSPSKSTKTRTPNRGLTPISVASPHRQGAVDDVFISPGVLEATIFRPALQTALRNASKWKAATISASLADLPPLPTFEPSSVVADAKAPDSPVSVASELLHLTSALSNLRLVKASARLIDLSRTDKSPREQLQERIENEWAANERLQEILLRHNGRAVS